MPRRGAGRSGVGSFVEALGSRYILANKTGRTIMVNMGANMSSKENQRCLESFCLIFFMCSLSETKAMLRIECEVRGRQGGDQWL